MMHPLPGALLELHFDEAAALERDAVAAHVRTCAACAAWIDEVRRLERALAAGPDDAPPPDGLQRVLARVAQTPPARRWGAGWAHVVFPSAAAMAAGAWAIREGAERLGALGLVPNAVAGSLPGDLLLVSLATAGVLAAGALVTLAVAPVLILESHGRS
jgi:hypothetical protein